MISEFTGLLPAERIKKNEPMKNHTSFSIGGPADLMLITESVEELKKVIAFCNRKGIEFFILGLGSNILVRDKGVRGVVIKLGDNLNRVSIENEIIIAEAGATLSQLAKTAMEHELSGLEFAEGIPGSLGGAIFMNAGAYNGEMKDILLEVTTVDKTGNIKVYAPDQMQMGYRKSIFQVNGEVIVSATLKMIKEKRNLIKARMDENARRRREKQPLDYPSAGSTFKRPTGYYVGPMIEELGLKGFQIGGAEVSAKHAGFIINSGNASAKNVVDLIALVQQKVKERYGIDLQTEIKIIGEE